MFKTQINRLLIVVVLFNLCAAIGCHRGYYRRQADAEAARLIREKAVDPRWNSSDGTIEVDPQSRMFDPFSVDHPPIPADDAASHQFMHRVDGKEGYPHWHANGDSDYIESPDWRSYLPVDENGQVVLTLEKAYELALIHSPDLQQQRETLYLSALDVSLERFGFDSQLFTGYNTFFTSQGRFRGAGGRSTSSVQSQIGANGGGLNIQKLGITGTNFAVGLANTILFNFAGNNTQSATSLIDFSLIQPLLRGAGRERIMESLTQAERTLLANVRQIERFRRGFYLQVAIGRDAGAGPNRGGNFLGTPGSASTGAGGYLGLLQAQQLIRNQRFNVRQQEASLALLTEFFERERLDIIQLKRFENSVYTEQRNLLDQLTSYQTQLDRYKLLLGLPPELDVVIDDSILDKFEFISDEVNDRLIATGELRGAAGDALNVVDLVFDDLGSVDDLKEGKFERPSDLVSRIEKLAPLVDQAEELLSQITEVDKKQIEADIAVLDANRDKRIAYLKQVQAAVDSGEIISNVDPGLFKPDSVQDPQELRDRLAKPDSVESLVNRAARLKLAFVEIQTDIAQFEKTQANLNNKELYDFIETEIQGKIPGRMSELNALVLEISLLQALARSNSVQLTKVQITDRDAIEIARCMRRDWMNARASHVDNWRNIEFVADQLEAQVDLVFEGDIGNTGDNPFKLRYETGQLRAGFRFDAPIVRLAERNRYREALINYQQSRRQYYQFEDNVKRNLREIVRSLNQNKVAFELDRRTVQINVENVEVNRFQLEKPVAPGSTGNQLGATTAQNLTDAIVNLNRSQNSFLRTWVSFEVLRRSLDFDMGTMQLDELGFWVDPGEIDNSIGMRAASMMGIELDCQYCNGMMNIGSSVSYPSNANPQTLPFESNSIIEPANSSNEFDGIIVPNTPSLNGPETGYRQRTRGNRTSSLDGGTPSRLFNPVSVVTAPRDPQPEIVKTKKSAKSSVTVSDLADNASPKTTANSPLKTEPPSANVESLTDTIALVADRIAQDFKDHAVTQATNLAPVSEVKAEVKMEAKTEVDQDKPTRDVVEPEPFFAVSPIRPVPPLESKQSTENSRTDHWQDYQYSLGKTLDRFRAESEK